MDKISVLMVCASLNLGGAEKVAQSIALHAPENEFEFHFLVFHREEGLYESALREKSCIIHRIPEPKDSYVRFIRNLRRLMITYRFQVVHAHTMFNCGLIMLCAASCGVPVRISHAHSVLNVERNRFTRIYEQVMQLLLLHFSTDWVSCSSQAGERLLGKNKFRNHGLVIPNGIDVPAFRFSQEARNRIRAQYQLENCLVLGHIGRMVPVKNQAFLLYLLPLLLEQNPDVRLLLIGDGEDRPILEGKIQELGIRNQVIFTGSVFYTADYLSAMDVFLFPSLFEGMPLALLEAQANGLPCVVSDSIAQDVFCTDLIHPLSLKASSSEWCNTILPLRRANPERYQKQLLSSVFSADRSAAKILSLYKKGLYHDQNTLPH